MRCEYISVSSIRISAIDWQCTSVAKFFWCVCSTFPSHKHQSLETHTTEIDFSTLASAQALSNSRIWSSLFTTSPSSTCPFFCFFPLNATAYLLNAQLLIVLLLCSWPSISSTLLLNKKSANTSLRDWCNPPTLTSWTSSALVCYEPSWREKICTG
jgi:hypothetical protein